MEPTSSAYFKKTCPICKELVDKSNFDLHEASCLRKQKKKNSSQSNISVMDSRNRVIITEEKPISLKSKQKFEIDQNNDDYQCPNCGSTFPLMELENHEVNCLHRQVECKFCKEYYPISLMSSHEDNCEKSPSLRNPNMNVFNIPNNEHDMEIEEENSNEINMPFQSNDGNSMFIRRVYDPSGRVSMTGFTISNPENPRSINLNFNENNDPSQIINFFGDFQQRSAIEDPFINIERVLGGNPGGFPRGFSYRGIMGNQFDLNMLPLILGNLQHGKRGLSKEQINELPRFNFKKLEGMGEEDTKCVICYSEFEENEMVRALLCSHKFHTECIDKWLEKNITCPVCKSDMLEEFRK